MLCILMRSGKWEGADITITLERMYSKGRWLWAFRFQLVSATIYRNFYYPHVRTLLGFIKLGFLNIVAKQNQ